MCKRVKRLYVDGRLSTTENISVGSQTRMNSGPELPVPRPFSSVFHRSIAYVGPAEWAKLPPARRSIADLDQFKRHARLIVDEEFVHLTRI